MQVELIPKSRDEKIVSSKREKELVLRKLVEVDRAWSRSNFARCHVESIFRTCGNCGAWEALPFTCCKKWCPLCNWRITRKRRDILGVFAKQIPQPKHVVLTARNTQAISRTQIKKFKVALARLLRSKLFRPVKGGTYSLEVTNEGRGWHLHAHLLLDVRWLPAGELAKKWGKLIGQDFAIVKVKDARGSEFVAEVAKYVCKGSELCKWSPDEISAFISAVSGPRLFGVFGSLFKRRRQILFELAREPKEPTVCSCGCGEFRYRDERAELLHQLRRQS